MKTVIVYSSKTGNTRKVADAIHEVVEGSEIKCCKENLEKEYDLYILGGWIDRATFDSGMLKFVENIKDQKVAYFFTLGAEPDSKHAQDCRDNIEKLLLENRNEILGNFCCQGAIDPKLIDWMLKLPSDHHMAPNEARKNRWKVAASHPDQEDLERAKEVFENIVKKIGGEIC